MMTRSLCKSTEVRRSRYGAEGEVRMGTEKRGVVTAKYVFVEVELAYTGLAIIY